MGFGRFINQIHIIITRIWVVPSGLKDRTHVDIWLKPVEIDINKVFFEFVFLILSHFFDILCLFLLSLLWSLQEKCGIVDW